MGTSTAALGFEEGELEVVAVEVEVLAFPDVEAVLHRPDY